MARQMLVMPKLLNKSSHLTQVTREGATHQPSPLPLDFQQTLSHIGWGSANQAQLVYLEPSGICVLSFLLFAVS